jgi:uncharacterized membrane protein YphA (DoxX/SURF4 family)
MFAAGPPIGVLARLLIAVILLMSSTSKLGSSAAFKSSLRALGLRRTRAWWISVCTGELLIAVSAITPMPPAVTAGLIAFLGIVFAGAGVRALTFSRPIQCACFGGGTRGNSDGPSF